MAISVVIIFFAPHFFAFATRQCRRRHYIFSRCPSAAFVRPSRQILFPRYLMNSLSNFDETHREYSMAPTDDLFRFCRSKVTVTVDRRSGEGINVDAGASKCISCLLLCNHCILHEIPSILCCSK